MVLQVIMLNRKVLMPVSKNCKMLLITLHDAPTLSLELNVTDAADVEDDEESEAVSTNSAHKRPANCVLQLIENKRKHLEKALSAAQRDKMLLEEAKEDARFRKEMRDSMRESSTTFAQGIKDVSKAILDMGAGLSRSIEMLSQGFHNQGYPQHHVINQNNMFYQYSSQCVPPHARNSHVYMPMHDVNSTPPASDKVQREGMTSLEH